ncbi:MAG TPA: phosphohistidine phosphatase SixA [Nitrososphaerales archaeon]|nr:phosphohistidine phosphatase SixA [Nitrososphaerales archaeon]
MDLYIFRHGEAGKSLPTPQRDRGRSLTSQGREDVETAAESMRKLGLRFDRIISSPLPRAKETAEIVAKTQKKVKVEAWDELRPEGDKSALRSKLAALGHDPKVLIVGHEPFLTAFVATMTGTREGAILLKKGGLIRIRVTTFSPAAKGELRWLLSPRILGHLA